MQNISEGESPKATAATGSFPPASAAGAASKAATASAGATPLNRGTACASAKTPMSTKSGHKLPEDLTKKMSGYLQSADAASLSITSTMHHRLLKQSMTERKSVKWAAYFLRYVVRGQHGLEQQMLGDHIELLCQRGRVTDCSGRVFESISGFEYALWALDKHQWDDMLACLPRDGKGYLTEKSLKVVAELKKQYTDVKTKGVTYTLNGVTKTESHYDFALIGELQKQVNAQNAAGDKDWSAIDKQFREGFGGAQRLCPMHVVDEYCSFTPFGPGVPSFNSRPQLATGSRQFFNSRSSVWESWFSANSKLGVDFAIVKGRVLGSRPHREVRVAHGPDVPYDLVAMRVLRETRTKNFSELEAQLNSLLAPTEVASSVLAAQAQHRPGM